VELWLTNSENVLSGAVWMDVYSHPAPNQQMMKMLDIAATAPWRAWLRTENRIEE
jgi:hypothetical protein